MDVLMERVDDRWAVAGGWRERHGWIEPCPWRCTARYWIGDGAEVDPARWDEHLEQCPNRPEPVPIYRLGSTEPVRWLMVPRRPARPPEPVVVCACRHTATRHGRRGCSDPACLCLAPPDLVREVYA